MDVGVTKTVCVGVGSGEDVNEEEVLVGRLTDGAVTEVGGAGIVGRSSVAVILMNSELEIFRHPEKRIATKIKGQIIVRTCSIIIIELSHFGM